MADIRVQALAVVAQSEVISGSHATISDGAGNYYVTTRVISPSSSLVGIPAGAVGSTPKLESVVLRETFSSVPIVARQELEKEFKDLGQALSDMRELDDDDQAQMETPVYQIACHVASELMAYAFPAPQVFSHGPKSIVFNWTRGANNLYLTISADLISALISTPERIKRRLEFSAKGLLNPAVVFPALQSAQSEQPIISSVNPAASRSAESIY